MRRFVFSLLFLLGTAGPASAALAEGTNTLESSSPAAEEVVSVAPTQLQLRFVEPAGTAEQVTQMGLALTCEGRLVGLGAPQLGSDGKTVSAPLTQVLNNGTCTVSWKLADDSAGSYSFVSNTQPTTTAVRPVTTDPADPGSSGGAASAPRRLGGPIGLARLLAFVLVSALFGAFCFVRFVWVEGVEYDVGERYFRLVSLAAAASMALLASLTTAAESQGSLASSFLPTSWFSLLDTNEGRAVFVRLVAVVALVYFAWVPARVFEPTNIPQSTAALVFVAVSYGFDRPTGRMLALGTVSSIVHMALVMFWVGSLAMTWRVVLFGPGERDLAHALRGWARLSMPVTLGIIATGVLQVWRLDGLSLVNSGHGRMVLLKAAAAGLVFFVGAAVSGFIRRKVSGSTGVNERLVHRLRRPVGAVVVLSIAVLAASSVMLSMRPPYILPREKGPREKYAIVRDLTGGDDFRVRVSLDPGSAGVNKMLVELFGPARIQNFTVSLVPAHEAFSGYRIALPVTRPGAALVGEKMGMRLLAPGDWTMTLEGTTTTGDLTPLTAAFVVADGVTVTTVAGQGTGATTTLGDQ